MSVFLFLVVVVVFDVVVCFPFAFIFFSFPLRCPVFHSAKTYPFRVVFSLGGAKKCIFKTRPFQDRRRLKAMTDRYTRYI